MPIVVRPSVVSCRFCHNKSTIQLMMAFYGCLKCRSVPSADNGCHRQTCHYPNKRLNKHSIPPDYLSFPLDGAPLWRTGKKQHTPQSQTNQLGEQPQGGAFPTATTSFLRHGHTGLSVLSARRCRYRVEIY